ncbi:MAG: 16S rRNA (cytidine(1402)-2'-O)-methyltransferase [Kofleriaceae bacterium]|nr:16S rRNA (cytidine(1402)-2'-O)-methyltransferase [Kofleriaceae bacterium]
MSSEQGILYVVATPIGNLEDASPRSRRILGEVDIVAAEDTRTARKLLDLLGIQAPRIVSYFEGNEASRSVELLAKLGQGMSIAVISEAGTPAVSDPGQRLVEEAGKAGFVVVGIPGPSAVITALVVSGLPTDRFTFIGFLPRDSGPRRLELGRLRTREETLVFYESPERVFACLRDMGEAFGEDRPAVLTRELTKLYEEVVRGTCATLAACYADKAPRGECTLVIGGASAAEAAEGPIDIEAAIDALLSEGLGPKDIAARLMVKTGKPRRELYQLALSLKRAR